MIHFQNKTRISVRSDYPALRNISSYILTDNDLIPSKTDLSVLFTNDWDIAELNSVYRDIEGPTDVLSFVADEIDPESGKRYLGDIVISLDQVKKQSLQYGDDKTAVIILLTIHGILHLLGYDHLESAEKQIMWRKQEQYLAFFKVKVHYPD
jgi:probable rRNA maturation factor